MIVQSSGTSCLGSHVYSMGHHVRHIMDSVSATGTEHRLIDTVEALNNRRKTCPSATSSATNAT